jgi:ABC-type Mn2+/Zn2+ transport system permease subunit
MLERIHTLFSMFPQALLAGVVIAAVCSLLGVFVILKRVVFIGIVLSEVAACGIAAGMVFGIHPYLGAGVLTLAAVALLAHPFETDRIPRDAVLGILFVLASALSILLVAKSGFGLEEVKHLLYGDLVLTTGKDLAVILAVLLPVLAWQLLTVRPTLYTFLDREAARLLGVRVNVWELAYFFCLGLAVSAASKVAGSMLVFCYLVVAPAAALVLSRRLWLVMLAAAGMAVASTVCGLYWSVANDLPANQTVAATACGGFLLALLARCVHLASLRVFGRKRPAKDIRT